MSEALLRKLVATVPTITAAMGFDRDTCILHTRATCDALRAMGVTVRPLTCRLVVANAAYGRLANELKRMPTTEDLAAHPEAHNLGVGFGRVRGDRGYDGHVIAVVDGRWGLDLTLDQANRPLKNIALEPHYFAATREFLRGDEPFAMRMNDCYVQYVAVPDDRGFLHAADWTMPPTVPRINPAPRIVRALAA